MEKRIYSELEAVPIHQGCGSGGDLGLEWDLLKQDVEPRPAAVCPLHCSSAAGKEGVIALS